MLLRKMDPKSGSGPRLFTTSPFESCLVGLPLRTLSRWLAPIASPNDTVAGYVSAGVQFFLTEVGPWIAAGTKDFVERATISPPRE